MSRTIDLSPEALDIVRTILRMHLPSDAQAWVFGSRATGTARRYSDLDLALEADEPISLDVIALVATALSESELPFKVDVLDLHTVEPRFRALIEPDMLPLPP
jgi:predicted nucleotidyltransferase